MVNEIGEANTCHYPRQKTGMFHPLGGKLKKLKDYFIDMKIPADKRDGIPLLACGSDIIWVIGYNISDKYKVTEKDDCVALKNIKD